MALLLGMIGLILGAITASFAATWALRRTIDKQAMAGRSRCDSCAHPLGYAETIPVFSYVAQLGRCRHCEQLISPIHPASELGGGLLVASILALRPWPISLLEAGLSIVLLALALVDMRTYTLPNFPVAIAAILCGLLAALQNVLWINLLVSATISLILFGAMVALKHLRGRSVMGFGDLKLIAGLTFWLGPDMTLALAAASMLGLLQIIVSRQRSAIIPFGPALIAGTLLVGLTVRPFFSLALS